MTFHKLRGWDLVLLGHMLLVWTLELLLIFGPALFSTSNLFGVLFFLICFRLLVRCLRLNNNSNF